MAGTRSLAPLARTQDLIVEDFSDEVLIYDQRTNEAHCLSREAAMVWRVCDGSTSPAELGTALNLDRDVVTRALGELDSCGLLDTGPVGGITRREATIKMARVGAAAAAAPLIYSIAAPTPALAATEHFCLQLCPSSCGACAQAGCCCCDPGGGNLKVCAIDCSHCTTDVLNQKHCNETLTSIACSAGC